MDFASQFPVLRPSIVLRNPSSLGGSSVGRVNVFNKVSGLRLGTSISGRSESILDQLEKDTVSSTDHLIIDETNGPAAHQIKALNAEIQYLRTQLETQSSGDKTQGFGGNLPQVSSGGTPKEATGGPSLQHPLSWSTVVAQNSGSSRMKLSYHPPQVKEAKLVVCPPVEVIEAGVAQWSDCVVGYFLDKKLPYIGVRNIASRIWKKFGIQKVMTNEQGFYFFEFSQADAARRVIAAGPWHFGGKLLILKKWHPEMQLVKEQMARVPIWAQFYNVPLVLWNEGGLSHLASAVGVPLYADDLTESRQRLSYAKICVEVDVGSELPDTVVVECTGEQVTVGVRYPWKPVKCLECHLFGHNADHCGSKPLGAKPQKSLWMVKSTECALAADSEVPTTVENGSSSAAVPGMVEPSSAVQALVSAGQEVAFIDDLVSTPVASPRAPQMGVGQSTMIRGSNSFSALTLVNQEDLMIGEGEDEVPGLLDHPSSAPDPELDVPFVPAAKKTRGRGNAKAVAPGGKKNNKGGGGGLKA
ncbi:hypothetical protein RHSIM_Rhsim13G0137500 [Rhododendron simsii]|uniref:DUF4283 domain-containing protein n=1 Tax=Rhododendron simsii TaxID=118357 RepID=A0A834G6T4_RHOSS|nr:hypothetical protein RHSIM_Rhsim13G0137500 [Rhododendron simsii]